MALKVCIAQTPLILHTPKGTEFRVEAGEAVELTPEQYSQVAAHVTEGSISDADLAAAGYVPEGEAPPGEGLPEVAAEVPKRSRGKAAE